jgi:hypothetical protein
MPVTSAIGITPRGSVDLLSSAPLDRAARRAVGWQRRRPCGSRRGERTSPELSGDRTGRWQACTEIARHLASTTIHFGSSLLRTTPHLHCRQAGSVWWCLWRDIELDLGHAKHKPRGMALEIAQRSHHKTVVELRSRQIAFKGKRAIQPHCSMQWNGAFRRPLVSGRKMDRVCKSVQVSSLLACSG